MSLIRKRRCRNCGCGGCNTCCFRFTFTGVTWNTGQMEEFETGAYRVVVGTQGTLNGVAFTTCYNIYSGDRNGLANIPFAMRIERYSEEDDAFLSVSFCGYVRLGFSWNNVTNQVNVTLGAFSSGYFFSATATVSSEQMAIIENSVNNGCSGSNAFSPVSVDNSEGDSEDYLSTGTGSVLIEFVPVCGTDPSFHGDCTVPEDFAHTLCDDPACPCGRNTNVPVCLEVMVNDLAGSPAIYQNNSIIFGQDDRNYAFFGPYRRDDGTFWRVVKVTNKATSPTPLFGYGSFFEKQCIGDNLDNHSGTYTFSDPDDWVSDGYNEYRFALLGYQTTLTNIGTTLTVADCGCADVPDVLTLSLRCAIGTTPAGWTDIVITRVGNSCYWDGSAGGKSAKLTRILGQWSTEVVVTATNALYVNAVPDEALGTHPVDESAPGLAGACPNLAIVIS